MLKKIKFIQAFFSGVLLEDEQVFELFKNDKSNLFNPEKTYTIYFCGLENDLIYEVHEILN